MRDLSAVNVLHLRPKKSENRTKQGQRCGGVYGGQSE